MGSAAILVLVLLVVLLLGVAIFSFPGER